MASPVAGEMLYVPPFAPVSVAFTLPLPTQTLAGYVTVVVTPVVTVIDFMGDVVPFPQELTGVTVRFPEVALDAKVIVTDGVVVVAVKVTPVPL